MYITVSRVTYVVENGFYRNVEPHWVVTWAGRHWPFDTVRQAMDFVVSKVIRYPHLKLRHL